MERWNVLAKPWLKIFHPDLSDLGGQEFADAKARANALHDKHPISQCVLAV